MTDTAAKPKPTRKPKSDPAAQYAKFLEAAKEAGADGDESAADALMERMAKSKSGPMEILQRSKKQLQD